MSRNSSVLSPRKDLVDSIRIKQDDGSEWLLLPNLELRMLKGPSKRGRPRKIVAEPEAVPTGLF